MRRASGCGLPFVGVCNRVMTMQSALMDALRDMQQTLATLIEEVTRLRDEKATLETRLAALEADTWKMVDPSVVQPLLDTIAGTLKEANAALAPAPAGKGKRKVQASAPSASPAAPADDADGPIDADFVDHPRGGDEPGKGNGYDHSLVLEARRVVGGSRVAKGG